MGVITSFITGDGAHLVVVLGMRVAFQKDAGSWQVKGKVGICDPKHVFATKKKPPTLHYTHTNHIQLSIT